MTTRVGIFVDVANVYYCISKKYPNRKLDYQKYVAALGKDVSYAAAYGTMMSDKVVAFVTALRHIGFQTFFRRGRIVNERMLKVEWAVGLAVNAISKLEELDEYVIGSGDPSLVPLVDYLRSKGKTVTVFACGINRALKERATSFVEIEEDVLEEDDSPVTV